MPVSNNDLHYFHESSPVCTLTCSRQLRWDEDDIAQLKASNQENSYSDDSESDGDEGPVKEDVEDDCHGFMFNTYSR